MRQHRLVQQVMQFCQARVWVVDCGTPSGAATHQQHMGPKALTSQLAVINLIVEGSSGSADPHQPTSHTRMQNQTPCRMHWARAPQALTMVLQPLIAHLVVAGGLRSQYICCTAATGPCLMQAVHTVNAVQQHAWQEVPEHLPVVHQASGHEAPEADMVHLIIVGFAYVGTDLGGRGYRMGQQSWSAPSNAWAFIAVWNGAAGVTWARIWGVTEDQQSWSA